MVNLTGSKPNVTTKKGRREYYDSQIEYVVEGSSHALLVVNKHTTQKNILILSSFIPFLIENIIT